MVRLPRSCVCLWRIFVGSISHRYQLPSRGTGWFLIGVIPIDAIAQIREAAVGFGRCAPGSRDVVSPATVKHWLDLDIAAVPKDGDPHRVETCYHRGPFV